MHKNATEVLTIFVDAMIKNTDMFLVQKAQHFLFQLSTAFAGDDLDQFDTFINSFLHDAVEFGFDLVAAIVDVVKVKLEFCHMLILLCPPHPVPPQILEFGEGKKDAEHFKNTRHLRSTDNYSLLYWFP
jgi:hypothetical protein